MKLHPTISMLSTMLLMGLHWATSAVSCRRRMTTHSKSRPSGRSHDAFCSHFTTPWPWRPNNVAWWTSQLTHIYPSGTHLRGSLHYAIYNMTEMAVFVIFKNEVPPVWDIYRSPLAWNEIKKYKAGQINQSDWTCMRDQPFSFASSVLLNTGCCVLFHVCVTKHV